MKYEPMIGDRLRDRYGRSGEIIDMVIEGDETKYCVQWQHGCGTITIDHCYGEVKKARRRHLKSQ